MRQFLAIAILGGALAVTASAAFADDSVRSIPFENSGPYVAGQAQTLNVAMAGEYHVPTSELRQENIGK